VGRWVVGLGFCFRDMWGVRWSEPGAAGGLRWATVGGIPVVVVMQTWRWGSLVGDVTIGGRAVVVGDVRKRRCPIGDVPVGCCASVVGDVPCGDHAAGVVGV
jgi:hypothetical protein